LKMLRKPRRTSVIPTNLQLHVWPTSLQLQVNIPLEKQRRNNLLLCTFHSETTRQKSLK
jgi:hypothetical protein